MKNLVGYLNPPEFLLRFWGRECRLLKEVSHKIVFEYWFTSPRFLYFGANTTKKSD